MKEKLILYLFSALIIIQTNGYTSSPIDSNYLRFNYLPQQWDEALPLGNGMVGALLWEKDGNLRFALDRADLWDLRPVTELQKMTFAWVVEQVEKDNYGIVQQRGDVPYGRDPYPTKIPVGALMFNTNSWGDVKRSFVDIYRGLAYTYWNNGVRLESFVHAKKPLGWFRFSGLSASIALSFDAPPYFKQLLTSSENATVRGHQLSHLGYPKGRLHQTHEKITYTQPGWNMEFQVSVRWKQSADVLEGVWSISAHYPDKDQTFAKTIVDNSIELGFETEKRQHLQWWKNFWKQSNITIPDTILQRQWYLEQYKLGCLARKGAPPISLQGVWTADNGNLPPWKGDFHHDLNTQLSYWPAYSANHLEEAASFTDWLWEIRKTNEQYTKNYFQVNGLNVPGVTTLTGAPMGGWIQYSMSPTVSAWLSQYFYWYWRYSMDEEFLKYRAYPYLHKTAIFLEQITEEQKGRRILPLSSSPEIGDNSKEAWFTQTTNYDLSLIHFVFKTTAEAAGAVGKKEEQQHWQKRLRQLPSLSIDNMTGLLVAPDHPLRESHRHLSHLMAIYPLGLLKPLSRPADSLIAIRSLQHLEKVGTHLWTGYSFAWAAQLYARIGDGQKAAKMIRIFSTHFTSPNSFHLNGDQKGGKYSKFTYRPFTLEGNFACAMAIQEMLMQSDEGVIYIFPAIPDNWETVSFHSLRAFGAFLVSAEKKNGRINKVRIESLKGGLLQLAYPFEKSRTYRLIRKKGTHSITKIIEPEEGFLLKLDTQAGEVLTFQVWEI